MGDATESLVVRLTQIKLAGFKSFVDPTAIAVPGQLVAVIGPNGCGKSNVIDAVRWVLGESSAKQLRGESMQDVIFNGSSTRKPVSRAAVELVFDNSDGQAAGAWSQYAEIAIKRVLTRQGESSYWINNQQVRRRDIADLFLGTGVGTRGYAVIEQGMISRIIEARPEELRAYLEEAAGVSKYKDRRKETESRLADTRDNLARIADIQAELTRQSEHLAEQAEVAQQYQQLTDTLNTRQSLLALVRQRDASLTEAATRTELAQRETELEALIAEATTLDTQLEGTREAHFTATDAVHAHQACLAEASANLARLEEQQRHHNDTHARLMREVQAAQQDLAALDGNQRSNAESLFDWESRQEEARYAAEEALLAAANEDALTAADAVFRQADAALTQRIQQQAEHLRRRDLALQRADHAARNYQQNQHRQAQLVAEQAQGQDAASDALTLSPHAFATAQQTLAAGQAQLTAAEAAQTAATQQHDHARQQLQHARDHRIQLEAEWRALDKWLTTAAQANNPTAAADWLNQHHGADTPPLWQTLRITAGWETAAEAILSPVMHAHLGRPAADAPSTRLALFAEGEAFLPSTRLALPRLADYLQTQDTRYCAGLADWLAGGYTVPDTATLIQKQATLQAGEWLVCPEGHLATPHSVVYWAPSAESGLIRGEADRQALVEALAAQAAPHAACEAALTQAEADLLAATQARQHAQAALAEAEAEGGRLAQQWAVQEAADQHKAHRHAAIQAERVQLAQQALEDTEHQALAQQEAEEATLILDTLVDDIDTARLARLDAETGLTLARARQREQDRVQQDLRLSLATADARVAELTRRAEELEERRVTLLEKHETLVFEQESLAESAADDRLAEAVAARLVCEQGLAQARDHAHAIAEHDRTLTQRRQAVEASLAPLRLAINEMQLKNQEARLAVERFDEILTEAQADLTTLTAQLTPGLKASGLVSEIGRLSQAITALGAVNLAALAELTAANERAAYLAAQTEDLTSAMTMLEEAIASIDQETRSRLQTTFDQVNASMAELFPLLFGGGRAALVLTGEDLLEAGVQIIAQPPGKKNATIHLLSGGEKALTAMSLVFSLFQLNPAPFCLLDEVDAPLDDANTSRFCALVKKMADKTQFLYISHNRLTMEMAEQLVGVTMQEQGVSRIVAVDILEALQLREH